MERIVLAKIIVDDERAFEETGDGPVAYLEREFGWLEQSGIWLEDCFIYDDEEDDLVGQCNSNGGDRQDYLDYVALWAKANRGVENDNSPLTYDEWKSKQEA